MAATTSAARLTEAYRIAQTKLGTQAARQMLDSWRLIDPRDIDGTVEPWLRLALTLVQSQRRTSAQLAADYLRTYRMLELGSLSGFSPRIAPPADPKALTTSLTVTGPAHLKAATARGVPLERAVDLARSTVARAAHRHVLDGGRTTIIDTIGADRSALGYARATSGKCCSFCAMLASRGAVYRSEQTADFQPHDGCSCSPEPIYRRDASLPPGSERFRDQWTEAKRLARDEDVDVTVAFRRLVENRA